MAEYMLAKKLVFAKITNAFGGRLRYVICGGAPLAPELGKFFQIAGIRLLEGYGLTETCGPVSVNQPDDMRFGTVGRPLAEVAVRVAADGEIEIKSRKVFAGYYRSREETDQVLKDGWFKTGDIGIIDSDGFIHITDRKKDIIVTAGGKNIAPQRIESIAKGISWISQIVVIGDRRPFVVALLTLNREEVMQTAAEKGILFSEYAELIKNPKIIAITHQAIEKINLQLAKYETIKKFIVLPGEFTITSGELTPSLKVKRKIVEDRYRTEIDGLYS
jgi:long-chain acyl-CoA synthetase